VRLSESERIERTPDRAHENVNARTEKGFSSPACTTDWRQLRRRKDTFVFVNTAARPLALTSVILQEAGDCDNAAANPDHRPLKAEFEFGAVAPAPTKPELLDRIEALERQMLELKTLIQRLP
jgi:hypothetical protein